MKVSLLTGGDASPHYVLALLSGLASAGVEVDCIGGNSIKDADVLTNKNVCFYNLRGDQNPDAPFTEKVFRILRYYLRLIKYAFVTESEIFHIQWLNRFVHFDRTFLNIYYKCLGKKLVFTAHNINAAQRDKNDNFINRFTLRFMYRIVDHLIVHTDKMKLQLIKDFNIEQNKITVIPHGILNIAPTTELQPNQARNRLNLKDNEKILLFFGSIAPYKGLQHLLLALATLIRRCNCYRLIIAGKIHKGCEAYWEGINAIIADYDLSNYLLKRINFIPDEDIEVYFKAADILILPYNHIFQSGLLFLAFNFGLPVIATDVGSFREEIADGKLGFVCQPNNHLDLATKIDEYFHSGLFRNLEANRSIIIEYANKKYSWKNIANKTSGVYRSIF